MVWYGMVTSFIHVCPSGTFTFKYRKLTNLTELEYKIKTKIVKMKRKHLLFKEAVCKNNISLISIISQSKICRFS